MRVTPEGGTPEIGGPRQVPCSPPLKHITAHMVFEIMSRNKKKIPVSYRVARCPVFHRPGRYFTANSADAGKKPVI